MTNRGTTPRWKNTQGNKGERSMETMHAREIDVESTAHHLTSETVFYGNDGAAYLLSPAPLLPEQFLPRPTGGLHPASGVRALMWAMLEDAITCVQKQALTPSRRHR